MKTQLLNKGSIMYRASICAIVQTLQMLRASLEVYKPWKDRQLCSGKRYTKQTSVCQGKLNGYFNITKMKAKQIKSYVLFKKMHNILTLRFKKEFGGKKVAKTNQNYTYTKLVRLWEYFSSSSFFYIFQKMYKFLD